MATENLLEEFPAVTTQQWEEAIAKDLKGADYARRLIWETEEGLKVKPYYRAEDLAGVALLDAEPGDFPFVRGARSSGNWSVCEEIDATDPEEANRAARNAVAGGAESIAFRSVAIANPSDLGMVLANLEGVPVRFDNASGPQVHLLVERLAKRPCSSTLGTGWSPLDSPEFAAEVLEARIPGFVPFTIHGEQFEESGATAVEELGFTLAAGIDYLAAMQALGADIDRAAAAVVFSFSIGANYYFQIAKFRAFRILWAQAVQSFGGQREAGCAWIHARTSRWNETVYDPHVNVLRATTEAMSAVLGGADSVAVAPFDECYKTPDEASRRLARNTQILLKQEALLSRVADPGAGSYLLEVLTGFLAREAWKRMQAIEAEEGFRKALASGTIARALARSLAVRERAVSSRKRVLTGTNQYANPAERALGRIEPARLASVRRGARAFEELRLRTERWAESAGKTPRVLLAEFGDVKMRSARSNFAANFFACAGFEIPIQRLETADAIAAASAELIVLCSADPEYLPMAAALGAKLKTLGRATPVLVAGNPESAEKLKAAGIVDFIHVRSNPLEVLATWQQRLGVKD